MSLSAIASSCTGMGNTSQPVTDDAEADVVVGAVGGVGVARRRPAGGRVVPGVAAAHHPLPLLAPSAARVLLRRPLVVALVEEVGAPLPDVAVYVVQAEAVGRLPPHRSHGGILV